MNLLLTGTLSVGKGTAARLLVKRGLSPLSFGDEVRKEADYRGIPRTRKNLQQLGADLRIEFGKEYWCKRLAVQMSPNVDYVIDGVRYPEDYWFFKERGRYVADTLLSMDAPLERRYEYSKMRRREGDAEKTFEQFKFENDVDLGLLGESVGQNVRACMHLSDYDFTNTKDKEYLDWYLGVLLAQIRALSK